MPDLNNVFDSPDFGLEFFSAPRDVPAELLAALEDKNYPAAYSALRRLNEPLSGRMAGDCLCAALDCTLKLFYALLDHCAPGEYASETSWKLPTGEGFVKVKGSILTLAAAMDKTAHMNVLLERGWDVNASSPASVQALCKHVPSFFDRFDRNVPAHTAESCMICAEAELHKVHGTSLMYEKWRIEYLTPLAAAIACGSVRAVWMLMMAPGVVTLKSSAVCRAAFLSLRAGLYNRRCVCTALGMKNLSHDPERFARTLLEQYALIPAAIADLCSVQEFAQRLKGVPCTAQELCEAAEALTHGKTEPDAKKLLKLTEICPAAGAEQRVLDAVLICALYLSDDADTQKKLLERWKLLSGEVRDISGPDSDSIAMHLAFGSYKGLKELLTQLEDGGSLCADKSSAWLSVFENSTQSLTYLLEHVRFYSAVPNRVSTLTHLILKKKDLRLLRKAVNAGVLADEPREALLACLELYDCPPAFRAYLLTMPRAHAEPGGASFAMQWVRASAEERLARLREMWETPLTEEECASRIRIISDFLPQLDHPLWSVSDDWGSVDGLVMDSTHVAACCGRNPALLRALLAENSSPLERVMLHWENTPECLMGTLLCLAAAAGRTDQVRELLERGMDPNENDAPQRSVFMSEPYVFDTVVTPLHMALKYGHLETAKLLERYGGISFPT